MASIIWKGGLLVTRLWLIRSVWLPHPEMRHYADVDRILNSRWFIRCITTRAGHSAAVEEHRDGRNIILNCLNCVLHLIAGGHVASVGKCLSPIDPDLFHRRLVLYRIQIHTDDCRPQQAQLDCNGLANASTGSDNLLKGQLINLGGIAGVLYSKLTTATSLAMDLARKGHRMRNRVCTMEKKVKMAK